MTIIYCITHLESGRYYIGKTKNSLLQRWRGHTYARNSVPTHIARALRKYGLDAFVVEELSRTEDDSKANDLEKIWIALTQSYDPKIGFNMTLGGDGGDVRLGRKHTEETKQKLSAKLKGRVFTPEWGKAISKAKKGKKDSEETRLRKSIAHTGTKVSPETLEIMKTAQLLRYEKEREMGIVKVVSKETRLKLSRVALGRKDPEETRRNKSIAATLAHARRKQLLEAA